MTCSTRHLLLPLAAVGGLMMAWTPASHAEGGARVAFAPTSRIWLEGDSTLHRYKSTASRFELTASAGPGLDLKRLQLVIPVRAMQSHDPQLDANMYKALKADSHPTIRFTLRDAKVTGGKGGAVAVAADGTLSVAGVERPVSVTASGTLSGSSFKLSGRKELKMTQFGIQPPVILGGMIRCADDVVVHYDLAGTLKD